MNLSNEHISEFQVLYKEEFAEDISQEEAHEQGLKLLHLVQLIYHPITREEFLRVQKEIEMVDDRISKKTKI